VSNGITLAETREHDAVREVVEHDGDVCPSEDSGKQSADSETRREVWTHLKVRPYGNAVLFNNLARSSNIRLGNISTLDDGDTVKVNVKPIGGEA